MKGCGDREKRWEKLAYLSVYRTPHRHERADLRGLCASSDPELVEGERVVTVCFCLFESVANDISASLRAHQRRINSARGKSYVKSRRCLTRGDVHDRLSMYIKGGHGDVEAQAH